MATHNARRSKRSSTRKSAPSHHPLMDEVSSKTSLITEERGPLRLNELLGLIDDRIRANANRPAVSMDTARLEREFMERLSGPNPAVVGSAPSTPTQSKELPRFTSMACGQAHFDSMQAVYSNLWAEHHNLDKLTPGSVEFNETIMRINSLRHDYDNLSQAYLGYVFYGAS